MIAGTKLDEEMYDTAFEEDEDKKEWHLDFEAIIS